MSVFGSLFTAVSGLSAQSQALSMISNNIANVSTVGFKRTDASFSSLVTSSTRSTLYSPGSVRAVQTARINQQGILQQSTSATDIAIAGNGFFVVKGDTSGLSEPFYTRAGSFSEDASGKLRNTGGFYLYGWPLDQNGNIPNASADTSSLVPVDVAFLGGLTQPTSNASIALNLDQTEDQGAYPIPATALPDYSRSMTVYDSLGSGHELTINYNKVQSPTAIANGTVDLSGIEGPLANTPPFSATDTFDITVAGVTKTITLDGDMGKLVSDINSMTDADGNYLAFASLDASGKLVIKARNAGDANATPPTTGDTLTLTDGTNTPLAALGLTAGTINPPASPPLLTGMSGTPNSEGWWKVQFVSSTGAVVKEGYVNFDGKGRLNATQTSIDGKVDIPLEDIDWGNGSERQDIAFDISKFSQFSGEYNVIGTNQNGAELGLRTGVTIDDDGYVTAQFSNGKSTKIYKLAIATFANPNGLDEITGNVFRESDSSGSFNLREAGKGSAGSIADGALEASNVDLADEFSKMIVTQRAYSANTKVISTADQMTQELLQLR